MGVKYIQVCLKINEMKCIGLCSDACLKTVREKKNLTGIGFWIFIKMNSLLHEWAQRPNN